MEERTIVAKAGDPVPESTSGKSIMGGVGAAIGGLLTAGISGVIVKMTGESLSAEVQANLLIVCTALGGAIGGAVGAYYKRNFLK